MWSCLFGKKLTTGMRNGPKICVGLHLFSSFSYDFYAFLFLSPFFKKRGEMQVVF
jgi:hypothetical protein